MFWNSEQFQLLSASLLRCFQIYLRVIFYVVERDRYRFKQEYGRTLCYEEVCVSALHALLRRETSCLWLTFQRILVEGVTE